MPLLRLITINNGRLIFWSIGLYVQQFLPKKQHVYIEASGRSVAKTLVDSTNCEKTVNIYQQVVLL